MHRADLSITGMRGALAKLIVCHDFIVDLNDGVSEA
jgi:hypothetical protein